MKNQLMAAVLVAIFLSGCANKSQVPLLGDIGRSTITRTEKIGRVDGEYYLTAKANLASLMLDKNDSTLMQLKKFLISTSYSLSLVCTVTVRRGAEEIAKMSNVLAVIESKGGELVNRERQDVRLLDFFPVGVTDDVRVELKWLYINEEQRTALADTLTKTNVPVGTVAPLLGQAVVVAQTVLDYAVKAQEGKLKQDSSLESGFSLDDIRKVEYFVAVPFGDVGKFQAKKKEILELANKESETPTSVLKSEGYPSFALVKFQLDKVKYSIDPKGEKVYDKVKPFADAIGRVSGQNEKLKECARGLAPFVNSLNLTRLDKTRLIVTALKDGYYDFNNLGQVPNSSCYDYASLLDLLNLNSSGDVDVVDHNQLYILQFARAWKDGVTPDGFLVSKNFNIAWTDGSRKPGINTRMSFVDFANSIRLQSADGYEVRDSGREVSFDAILLPSDSTERVGARVTVSLDGNRRNPLATAVRLEAKP